MRASAKGVPSINFYDFSMAQSEFGPRPPESEADALPLNYRGVFLGSKSDCALIMSTDLRDTILDFSC